MPARYTGCALPIVRLSHLVVQVSRAAFGHRIVVQFLTVGDQQTVCATTVERLVATCALTTRFACNAGRILIFNLTARVNGRLVVFGFSRLQASSSFFS